MIASRNFVELFGDEVEFGSTVDEVMFAADVRHAGDDARRLGVSQRTFARRLSAEGLSFSELLEQPGSDLAKRYLGENELPTSQIAWLLGHREVGAFRARSSDGPARRPGTCVPVMARDVPAAFHRRPCF